MQLFGNEFNQTNILKKISKQLHEFIVDEFNALLAGPFPIAINLAFNFPNKFLVLVAVFLILLPDPILLGQLTNPLLPPKGTNLVPAASHSLKRFHWQQAINS